MSDIYVRDTTKALEEADSLFADILPELKDNYSEKWNAVCIEVTGSLEEYIKLLEERDNLLEKLEEK